MGNTAQAGWDFVFIREESLVCLDASRENEGEDDSDSARDPCGTLASEEVKDPHC